MSKMHFEYYDGKYCKIPSNLYAEPISPNHKLEYWVFKNKDTNKFLKCVESELGIPSYSFTADSHKDEDIVCIVPGGIGFSNMCESSEDPEEITLEYLGKDNVVLIPYFREVMWVKIDGKKVYNDNRSTWDKFCVSALDDIPVIPPGKVWDGYYMGDTKVDGMFVFEEWMAGCNIESRFHDQVQVNIIYMLKGKEHDRIIRSVKYGGEITVNIPYEDNIHYQSSTKAYKDEHCLIKSDDIITPTENTNIYIELTKIHKISLINKSLGYAENDYVLDGTPYGTFETGKPTLYGYNFEGLYQDEDMYNKYNLPMIVNRDMTIYVNFVRNEEYTINIKGKDFTGYYDKNSDSYFIELMDVDPTFVGLNVSILLDEILIKPGRVLGQSYAVLQIPARYTVSSVMTPIFAKPLTWKILPSYIQDGKLVPYVDPIELEIPYNTTLGSYYSPISLPKFEHDDFEEPDSHLALSGRVFMDNGCTRKVVSPEIEGNAVYASYTGRPDFSLPDAFLKVDRKPSMTVSIIDTGSGDINPKEFIVATDQVLKLSKDKFEITNPEGKVFSHFSYTNPYTKKEKTVHLPSELVAEWSYQLITHWSDPVKAILIVDKDDRSQDIVYTADNPDKLEFTIPNIQPVKEGYFFVGWSGLPEVGEQFTITETTEFEPIWETEDHRPVPLEV